MVRRTTINLDADLVLQAREILKAKNTTDTVHEALREVIRRDRLRRLAERKWGMTLEDLQELRRSRVQTRPWGDSEREAREAATPRSPGRGASVLFPEDPVAEGPKKAA